MLHIAIIAKKMFYWKLLQNHKADHGSNLLKLLFYILQIINQYINLLQTCAVCLLGADSINAWN